MANLKSITFDTDISNVPEVPVGCTIITSTNTDPATLYGYGTWTNTDREYKNQILRNVGFECTSNCKFTESETNTRVFVADGHTIWVRLFITNLVELNDTNKDLGYIVGSEVGITGWPFATHFVGESDVGNAIFSIGCTAESSGRLKVYFKDCLSRDGTNKVPANTGLNISWYMPITQDCMMDSFCDKFYWERTA